MNWLIFWCIFGAIVLALAALFAIYAIYTSWELIDNLNASNEYLITRLSELRKDNIRLRIKHNDGEG